MANNGGGSRRLTAGECFPNSPYETVIPGQVPLRGLWWGLPEAAGASIKWSGAPVTVLLHGVGDGADVWRPLMAAWPQARSPGIVLALDLPGHGGSGRLKPDRYRIGELARIVDAVLEGLALTRPLIIGHSMGARVALELVGKLGLEPSGTILIDMNPDNKAQIEEAIADHIDVLIAGAPTLDSLLARLAERLPLTDPEAVSLAMAAMTIADRDRIRVAHDPAIKALITDKSDTWNLLQQLKGPVSLIRGAYSSALSKATADRMLASLQLSLGIETIPMAGHGIPLEQPAALASAVSRIADQLGVA